MEHTVKTRGGLIRPPADRLLKRIQSVAKNSAVKMPSCMVFSVPRPRSNNRLNYTPKKQHSSTSARTFKCMLKPSQTSFGRWRTSAFSSEIGILTAIQSKCQVDRLYAKEIFTRIQSVAHNFIKRRESLRANFTSELVYPDGVGQRKNSFCISDKVGDMRCMSGPSTEGPYIRQS